MKKSIKLNKVTKRLPKHLLKFIVNQPYNDYTSQNQAVWRYVMRVNIDYLSKVAHESYIKGLEQTGVSIDQIPHMYGMNRILKEIGWAAVAVDGSVKQNLATEDEVWEPAWSPFNNK